MFKLPPLPYPDSALEPVLGAETLRIHHGRHHARYVQVVNEMADGATRSLEALIEDALARADAKLFNNAAQAWNHAFFWESMTPASAPPAGALADAIGGAFGDLAGLRRQFITKGSAQFGSGWVWLVADGGTLEVVTTHDADVPWLAGARVPLLVCDVWEHAYYLDYRNERDRYLGAWFDRLANWSFAARQLGPASGRYRFPPPG
ncbi:MAG: superoxide dismutase [Steroidobacteraceae bacterium]